MKNKLNNFALFALLFIVFACSSTTFAQKAPVVGGYATISVKDKTVIKAAKFAVTQRAKTQNTKVNLVEIKNAKMQVVAGRNYEICLLTNYLNKRSDKLVDQFVRVVVYRDLKNKYTLTSWTQENCTEE
jgi:hypothetical protein